jgi:pimeloyl-ACP methyl ester carboxylesterase
MTMVRKEDAMRVNFLKALMMAALVAAVSWTAGSVVTAGEEADHDMIKFRADDNVWVHADVYIVEKGKRAPIVMLFHQARSNGRAEYAHHIPKLIENGYNVLVVDQRSGGEQFGGENRTVEGESGEEYSYCEAYLDLEAALEYVIDERFSGSRYAWGSSYSASLVLRLGMEYPDELAGVLAFSPAVGGPMAPCSTTVYITNIEIPSFIAIPAYEVTKYRGTKKRKNKKLAAAAANYVDEFYVAEPATHGASMLDPDRSGGNVDKTWNAVLNFMKSNR